MILKTKRLILRPWEENDANQLYKYAKDSRIGPVAGWPVHTSLENSLEIIKDVFNDDGIFAVVLKEKNSVVGSIGILIGEKSDISLNNEAEIGYWIGVPYWGQGLIPEAVNEIIRYGFEDLKLDKIWCAYYDGNEKSHRVQQKCGFIYHHTEKNKKCLLMNDIRTEHISCINNLEWQNKKQR